MADPSDPHTVHCCAIFDLRTRTLRANNRLLRSLSRQPPPPPPPPFCSAATGTVRLSTTSPVYSPTFYNCPFSNLLHAVGGSPWPPRLVIQLCTMWDLPINMLASFLGLPAFALRIAFRTIQGSGSATLPLPCGRKPKNKNGRVLGTRL